MTIPRVLFLGADPTGGTFELAQELAMVGAELRACGRGFAFEIVSDLDVQPNDLQRLLNQHEPDLLHFSGHVTEQGELMFIDGAGQPKVVSAELFARIVGNRKKLVRCVVLNSCNGELAAAALREHVETVVTMVGLVSVQAAQVFARRFYEAIAAEYSVRVAFDQALLDVELAGLKEELQAVLLERESGVASHVAFTHGQPHNPHAPKPRPHLESGATGGVFVSYAHSDSSWMERICTMIQPLQRTYAVDVWDDRRIEASQDWRAEIEGALSRARIAVLLVTPRFLTSEFIQKCELPALLAARERGALDILWVYVSPCLVEDSPLASIQAAHRPAEPLVTLSPADQELHLLQVARKARECLQAARESITSSSTRAATVV